jgi:hypothetical protein
VLLVALLEPAKLVLLEAKPLVLPVIELAPVEVLPVLCAPSDVELLSLAARPLWSCVLLVALLEPVELVLFEAKPLVLPVIELAPVEVLPVLCPPNDVELLSLAARPDCCEPLVLPTADVELVLLAPGAAKPELSPWLPATLDVSFEASPACVLVERVPFALLPVAAPVPLETADVPFDARSLLRFI